MLLIRNLSNNPCLSHLQDRYQEMIHPRISQMVLTKQQQHSRSQLSILMLRSLCTTRVPSLSRRGHPVRRRLHVPIHHRHHSMRQEWQPWLCPPTSSPPVNQRSLSPTRVTASVKQSRWRCHTDQTWRRKPCKWQQLQDSHFWPRHLCTHSSQCPTIHRVT